MRDTAKNTETLQVATPLEQQFAATLGKEAAIFLPTGTLANHLAIRTLCGRKPRAVVQEQSHLYNDSGDCVSRLSGITLVPLGKDQPAFALDELQAAVERAVTGRVLNPIGAVMIESPVRRQMGQIFSIRSDVRRRPRHRQCIERGRSGD